MGEIQEPGFLEGGDFFAAGEDLALTGIGLRSNIEACQQLMNNNWLGTDRLAVVKDDFEQHQVSHLLHFSTASCCRKQHAVLIRSKDCSCSYPTPPMLGIMMFTIS